MEENRIFDLVLVKFGHFLVKCGFLFEKSGIDVMDLVSGCFLV
jgi:hypothetical protein